MTQSVKRRGTRIKKNEQSLRDLWDTNGHIDRHIMGGQRGRTEETT